MIFLNVFSEFEEGTKDGRVGAVRARIHFHEGLRGLQDWRLHLGHTTPTAAMGLLDVLGE